MRYLLSVLYESVARATISSKLLITDNHRGEHDAITESAETHCQLFRG